MEKIFEYYIKTTPEKLWAALTDPEQTAIYYFGNSYITDWVPGSAFTTTNPNADGPLGEGTIVESEPNRKLVVTMTALWSEAVQAEGESRITYEITQIEDTCLLTVTHDRMNAGAHGELYGGWPMILSGMKTWLETGERLTTPGSLMYT
ncbi:SRPBCC family protein [Paeniglutamicibacter sp. NPDC012692]|uniref:SRPBCC family protein n=1 Tax=Paeniglutamicibacter sp. NPDC012692 TaxID=3364388 RepID=UPI003679603B